MASLLKAVAKKSLKAAKEKLWRPSFTLVELMVVISIIGIMASMILYTLAGAQRDAYVARTQGTIKKLNDIILPMWEEYRYRSVKLNIPQSFLVPYKMASGGQVILAPREGARARMMALRDLMRMEMPDRYTDILFPPIALRIGAYTADNYLSSPVTDNDMLIESATNTGTIDREVPGRLQAFRRKMVTEPGSNGYPLTVNPYPAAAPVAAVGSLKTGLSLTNQGAELLYQIVSSSSFQGTSALEFFRPSEIGDTDGDGYKEFLDAWGRPIYFLRWPAGYASDLNDPLVPDPMDPLKTDWRWTGTGQKPWMLVPLIISAGPDGEFDIAFDFNPDGNGKFKPCVDPDAPYGGVQYAETFYNASTDPGGVNIQLTKGKYYFPDPYAEYAVDKVKDPLKVGAYFDRLSDGDNSLDNITNYELVLQ